MTFDDVIRHNPQFRFLCWEVKTPKGEIISVSTRKHAEKVALEEWPALSESSPQREPDSPVGWGGHLPGPVEP